MLVGFICHDILKCSSGIENLSHREGLVGLEAGAQAIFNTSQTW